MPQKRMVSQAKTLVGSMMMDFGMSNRAHSERGLNILYLFLQHLQETRAGGAVNYLVIAGQRQADGVDEHHRGLPAHRLHLDCAHAKSRDLRRVQDRCE